MTIDEHAETIIRSSATALRERLARGELTARDVALACLARVAARDGAVHAWAFIDPEIVLAQADALDAHAATGASLGPLHGVPVGIKDIILTQDQPTRYNSPLYPDFHPRIDASCVALLRTAGALVFGKTDTVEFGATGRRALTRNPHALDHTPGGSSSGSAAAVADNQVPLALGTQTGGSIIRPASFCGIWAMKPTWGLVSNEGARRYAPTLDTLGWFAGCVDDLRLLYDVFDPDATSADGTSFDLRGASIAVYRTPAWHRADRCTVDALEQARTRLLGSGARVVDIDDQLPFEALPALQMRIMRSEARSSLLADYRRAPEQLHASLRDQVLNTDGTTARQLVDTYDHAARCRATFDSVASSFDAVLTPSTIGSAPRGLVDTGDLIFNGLWTLLHVPCINVPGWHDDHGLPVGLTLTGPRYSDRRLLAVAQAFGWSLDQHTSAFAA